MKIYRRVFVYEHMFLRITSLFFVVERRGTTSRICENFAAKRSHRCLSSRVAPAPLVTVIAAAAAAITAAAAAAAAVAPAAAAVATPAALAVIREAAAAPPVRRAPPLIPIATGPSTLVFSYRVTRTCVGGMSTAAASRRCLALSRRCMARSRRCH